MKRAGPVPTLKSVESLRTWPVGPPATVTTRVSFAPVLPSYRVDLSVPSSETHHGPVELWDIPQPLTRSGSVISALPGTSDWRLRTLYRFSAFGFRAAAGSTTPSNPRLAPSARASRAVFIEVGIVFMFSFLCLENRNDPGRLPSEKSNTVVTFAAPIVERIPSASSAIQPNADHSPM